MNQTEKLKKEVVKKETTDIRTLIEKSTKELGKALPRHMNAERLVRIATTTLRLNPDLYTCTQESFLGALFQSAQLGLEPNVEGQAYIIPFKNYKTNKMEAQFQIGYKGYVELFYRHEKSKSLFFDTVCENDMFDYEQGTESFLRHKRALKNRGEEIGYYAIAKLKDGGQIFLFMSKDDCIEHGKKHSKCYDKKKGEFYANTPWVTDTDKMCLKTVLIQLNKLLPKSVELQKAIAMDDTVKTRVDSDMFNVKDETVWNDDVEDAQVVENEKIEDKTDQSEKINQTQIAKLMACAGEKYKGKKAKEIEELVNNYLLSNYGIDSKKDILVEWYDDILSQFK